MSSAHTVDKEPAGFPLGKITSCYTLGIFQTASSPSIPCSISPILPSNQPHAAVQIESLPTPSFNKGCGPAHSECSSSQIPRKGKKNSTLQVLSPLFKDGLFYFHRQIKIPNLLQRDSLWMPRSTGTTTCESKPQRQHPQGTIITGMRKRSTY